ncbi:hypothetical protein [Methylotenera sp.]|jgi:hypothetical protein|uniref:hypothetical protein n=1 Tax=Methylotenera sp. TaxID=2051956 RepID=UPI00271EBB9C|nr:hypothetical protein [Methylotenera sp.]MDO9206257.1 hypothetical protein [Methylotenera sp.]
MLRFLSVIFATVLFSYSMPSISGDCNKTVMGGGCSAEAEAGVAAHMRSQPQVKPAALKAKAAEVNVKDASVSKNVKMSKANTQKPQI